MENNNPNDNTSKYPTSINMSTLNLMAMKVQCRQAILAEERGVDASMIRSEQWLTQLLHETAVELQQKGVKILYD